MAELVVEGDDLVLRLSTAEKVEGVHGDLRAPLTEVREVTVLDDAHQAAGIRAGLKVGTRLPGVIEVGTILGRAKRFAAVHHDTPRGVRVSWTAPPTTSGSSAAPPPRPSPPGSTRCSARGDQQVPVRAQGREQGVDVGVVVVAVR